MERKETDLVDFVYSLYREAKPYKETVSKYWKKYEDHYNAEVKLRASQDVYEPRAFAYIEQQISMLTDAKPKLFINARKASTVENAKTLNKTVDHFWDMMNLDKALNDLLIYQAVYGVGFLKSYWDGDEKTGKLKVEAVDPWSLYVDPDATDFSDAKYVLWKGWKPCYELRLKYGIEVEPGGRLESPGNYPGSRIQTISEKNEGKRVYPSAEVVEAYFKDEYGLWWVIVANGKILHSLDPRETEYGAPFAHKKFPYIRIPGYGTKFWSSGDMKYLLSLQEALTRRRATIERELRRLKGIWLISNNAGITKEQVRSAEEGDGILAYNSGGQVSKVFGQPLPAEAFNSVLDIYQAMERTLGTDEVSFGEPKGVKSGRMLEGLMEASFLRARRKGKRLEQAFQDFGEQLLSNIKQFYTWQDTFMVTGEEVKYDPEILTELDQYEFKIDFTASLPMSKTMMRNTAIMLYSMQIIDGEAVVDAFDNAGFKEAARRMEEKKQAMLAMGIVPGGKKDGKTVKPSLPLGLGRLGGMG